MFAFENLRVYRRAERCLGLVYEIAAGLPRRERYTLVNQLVRASISVILNTAESTERRSPRDAARFVEIALGSLVEVVACLRIVETVPGAADPRLLARTRQEYESLYRQLHAYRHSLQRPRPPAPPRPTP